MSARPRREGTVQMGLSRLCVVLWVLVAGGLMGEWGTIQATSFALPRDRPAKIYTQADSGDWRTVASCDLIVIGRIGNLSSPRGWATAVADRSEVKLRIRIEEVLYDPHGLFPSGQGTVQLLIAPVAIPYPHDRFCFLLNVSGALPDQLFPRYAGRLPEKFALNSPFQPETGAALIAAVERERVAGVRNAIGRLNGALEERLVPAAVPPEVERVVGKWFADFEAGMQPQFKGLGRSKDWIWCVLKRLLEVKEAGDGRPRKPVTFQAGLFYLKAATAAGLADQLLREMTGESHPFKSSDWSRFQLERARRFWRAYWILDRQTSHETVP